MNIKTCICGREMVAAIFNYYCPDDNCATNRTVAKEEPEAGPKINVDFKNKAGWEELKDDRSGGRFNKEVQQEAAQMMGTGPDWPEIELRILAQHVSPRREGETANDFGERIHAMLAKFHINTTTGRFRTDQPNIGSAPSYDRCSRCQGTRVFRDYRGYEYNCSCTSPTGRTTRRDPVSYTSFGRPRRLSSPPPQHWADILRASLYNTPFGGEGKVTQDHHYTPEEGHVSFDIEGMPWSKEPRTVMGVDFGVEPSVVAYHLVNTVHDAFEMEVDVHTLEAMKIFGRTRPEDVTPKERKAAKTATFGELYRDQGTALDDVRARTHKLEDLRTRIRKEDLGGERERAALAEAQVKKEIDDKKRIKDYRSRFTSTIPKMTEERADEFMLRAMEWPKTIRIVSGGWGAREEGDTNNSTLLGVMSLIRVPSADRGMFAEYDYVMVSPVQCRFACNLYRGDTARFSAKLRKRDYGMSDDEKRAAKGHVRDIELCFQEDLLRLNRGRRRPRSPTEAETALYKSLLTGEE